MFLYRNELTVNAPKILILYTPSNLNFDMKNRLDKILISLIFDQYQLNHY